MPRQADPDLEGRILDAAQRLWKQGGAQSLTMRSVASRAKTNTPAVYRRFKNRNDILRGLLRRVQQEVSSTIQPSASPEEACERYLDFAVSHPHEYKLFYEHAHQLPRAAPSTPLREHRPTMQIMEQKLAERLGGQSSDHTRLSLALWAFTHGTAMILLTKSIPAEHAGELRDVFRATVKKMVTSGRVD